MTRQEVIEAAKCPAYVVLTGDRATNDQIIRLVKQLAEEGVVKRWSDDGDARDLVPGDRSLNHAAIGVRIPAGRPII